MPAVKHEQALNERQHHRRVFKPIIEKRRRDRINTCLEELKKLVLEGMNKDSTRHSKLEKADILEMTVKYLKSVQMQQQAIANNEYMHKYRAGYTECATAVGQYINGGEAMDTSVRARLMQHLQGKMSQQQGRVLSQQSKLVAEPLKQEPVSPQQLSPQQQAAIQHRLSSSQNKEPLCYVGLNLVPTRLQNGDIAYVVPGSQMIASHQQVIDYSRQHSPSMTTISPNVSPVTSPVAKDMWRPW